MRRMLGTIGSAMLAGLLLVAAPTVAQGAEDEQLFDGSVELLYRNVNQKGSQGRYNEDFDGLGSGARLSGLTANWRRIDSEWVDHLRLEASGLGGDPYERIALRMGRKDAYDFEITHTKQVYLYNLFGLVPDQDGHVWDAQRALTDVGLTLHATDKIDVFFEFQQVQRDGSSLFMKTLQTDLFQLDTPLDQNVKRYSVGGTFRLGVVDLYFRQMLRRYEYIFDNTTSGDLGLDLTNPASLNSYDWRQNDTGDAHLTTITLRAPLGQRANLAVTAFGTLLGKEEISSRVALDYEGTSSAGAPVQVTDGFSTADVEADHLMLDADLSVRLAAPLDFHLQMRSLEREVNGTQLRDLDGNGVPDDTEGIVNDTTPGSTTLVDYELTTVTGLFEWSPSTKARFRAGYRTIDRELERNGFEYGFSGYRNTNFESKGDDTLIFGMVLRPLDWFRLNADYEEGDIAQAFTATAPMETDRLRVQAQFQPQEQMRIDLGYLDYRNLNTGVDFREQGDCSAPGADIDVGCWASSVEGVMYSATFTHKADDHFSYWLRWARRETDSVIRVRFDTAAFGVAENGNSIFDNTSTLWSGQLDYRGIGPWDTFLRFRVNDSDGRDDLVGTTFVNRLPIQQDYVDWELGITYNFESGLYLGARYRGFDYDDFNDLLDYDGNIFTVVAGLNF